MQQVIWTEAMAVDVELLDEHHRGMFQIINEAHELVASSTPPRERIVALAEELAAYAEQHFSAEEAHLEGIGYPELADHQAQHEQYAHLITDFARRAADPDELLAADMVRFLEFWLVEHIKREDGKYAAWARQQGQM